MARTADTEVPTTSCGADRPTEVTSSARPATKNDLELYGSDFESTTSTDYVVIDDGMRPLAADAVSELPKEPSSPAVPAKGLHEVTPLKTAKPKHTQEGDAQPKVESVVDKSIEENMKHNEMDEPTDNKEHIDDSGTGRIEKGPFTRITEYGEYMRSMEERVAYLEADLQVRGGKNAKAQSKPEHSPAIPRLQRLTWLEFMNKVVDEQSCAVEVLYGGAEYYYQRDKDIRRGRNAALDASRLSQSTLKGDHAVSGHFNVALAREGPDRIRINSIPVLNILGGLLDTKWRMDSIVIHHPFKMLIYYEEEIKATLVKLEQKWSILEKEELLRQADGLPSNLSSYGQPSKDKKIFSSAEDPKDSVEALRDLRCLVQFMEEDLKPLSKSFQDSTCQKVRFRDLWYLYKPGDELIAPFSQSLDNESYKPGSCDALTGMTYPKKSLPDRYQTAWRVLQVLNGRPNLSPNNDEHHLPPPRENRNAFILQCYYVEYDGNEFGPVVHNFPIAPYDGERDITSLEIFPLRFANIAQKVRDDLKRRGELFVEYTTPKQRYHKGKTIDSHPNGFPFRGDILPRRSEYLEGQVVVDFKETFQRFPNWIPKFHHFMDMPILNELSDSYPVRYWRSYGQEKPEFLQFDNIQNDHFIDVKIVDEHIRAEPLLNADRLITNGSQLHDDLLILLPARVFGFVLSTRNFSPLNIENLVPLKPQEESFNSLKLPPGYRRSIEALVESHLTEPEDGYYHDFVRAKDRGLTILLHGASGVGKTATAECVAESNGRLLLPITSADVADFEDHELQSDLKLAEQWGFILLLDDVDKLFPRWRGYDSERGKSALLRLLDQYTGIVFMTTKDLRSLDEDVESRAHFSLHYPPLDGKQSYEIWKMNIERLEARKTMLIDKAGILDSARSKFNELRDRDEESWNGKEIRNEFRKAVALAEYDAARESINLNGAIVRSVPVLRKDHFESLALRTCEYSEFVDLISVKPRRSRHRSRSDVQVVEYSSDDDVPIIVEDKPVTKPMPPPLQPYYSQYPAPRGFSFPNHQLEYPHYQHHYGEAPPYPPQPPVLPYPPPNPSIYHSGNPGYFHPGGPFGTGAPTTGPFGNSATASGETFRANATANTLFGPATAASPPAAPIHPNGTIGHVPDGKAFIPMTIPNAQSGTTEAVPYPTPSSPTTLPPPPFFSQPPPPPPFFSRPAPPPPLPPARRPDPTFSPQPRGPPDASADRSWPQTSAGVDPNHKHGKLCNRPRKMAGW